MEELYRIEEETTSGWVVVGSSSRGLNKDQTKEQWDILLAEGYNPNALRIIREQ